MQKKETDVLELLTKGQINWGGIILLALIGGNFLHLGSDDASASDQAHDTFVQAVTNNENKIDKLFGQVDDLKNEMQIIRLELCPLKKK